MFVYELTVDGGAEVHPIDGSAIVPSEQGISWVFIFLIEGLIEGLRFPWRVLLEFWPQLDLPLDLRLDPQPIINWLNKIIQHCINKPIRQHANYESENCITERGMRLGNFIRVSSCESVKKSRVHKHNNCKRTYDTDENI